MLIIKGLRWFGAVLVRLWGAKGCKRVDSVQKGVRLGMMLQARGSMWFQGSAGGEGVPCFARGGVSLNGSSRREFSGKGLFWGSANGFGRWKAGAVARQIYLEGLIEDSVSRSGLFECRWSNFKKNARGAEWGTR